MNGIDYVVRDAFGQLSRGTFGFLDSQDVLQVDSSSEVSLNIARDDIHDYRRVGTTLEIYLEDGRVIVLEEFFSELTQTNSRLYLSADSELVEITFSESWGRTNYAHFDPNAATVSEGDLIFDSASGVIDVAGGVIEPDTTMAAPLLVGGLGGGIGAVGAGAAALAGTTLIAGGGGGGGAGVTYTNAVEETKDDSVTQGSVAAGEDTTFTGTGTPGNSVEVKIGTKTYETTVGGDGKWDVVVPHDDMPDDGTYDTTVVITAPDGTDETLDGPTITVDTTPPTVAFGSGTQGAGDIVDSNWHSGGVEITGTGEPGTKVTLNVGEHAQTAIVGSDGNWYVNFPTSQVPDGEYSTPITLVAEDAVGNKTTVNDTLVVDTEADHLTLDGPIEGDDVINGVETADGVTLSGQTEPNASVVVTFAGVQKTVAASATGVYQAFFSDAELPNGEYDTTAQAKLTDAGGNVSTASRAVRFDTEVDPFGLTSGPVEGDNVVSAAEAADGINLSGVTEPGSSVSVTLGNVTRAATVQPDGTWAVTFGSGDIPSGEYSTTLSAKTTDPAGNSETLNQSVVVDTEAGTLTISSAAVETDDVINAAEASDGVVLRGTADPSATVDVALGSVSRTVIADNFGNWQAAFAANEIPPGDYTSQISAKTTDAAGNSLSVSDSVKVDTSVTDFAFSSTPVEGDDVVSAAEAQNGVAFSGMVEPGSSVLVTLGSVSRSALVAANGAWTVNFTGAEIPDGDYLSTVSAKATDAAGNTSVVSDQFQVDTVVEGLAITSQPVANSGTLNAEAASNGISFAGKVEAGSTVFVSFEGTSRAATVDASGNWAVTFAASDVPVGQYQGDVVVTATDAVGNTSSTSTSFNVDTSVPDTPIISEVSTGLSGLRGLSTLLGAHEYDIVEVNAFGGTKDVAYTETDDPTWGETSFKFTSPITDGSNLVVTATDDAGNQSGTLFVMENDANPVVDLTNSGLNNYNIEAVDLQFASDAQMTITEAQLKELSGNGDSLTIHGGSDDTVRVAGATKTGQTQQIGTQTYDVYTLGDDGVSLIIDDNIQVLT